MPEGSAAPTASLFMQKAISDPRERQEGSCEVPVSSKKKWNLEKPRDNLSIQERVCIAFGIIQKKQFAARQHHDFCNEY